MRLKGWLRRRDRSLQESPPHNGKGHLLFLVIFISLLTDFHFKPGYPVVSMHFIWRRVGVSPKENMMGWLMFLVSFVWCFSFFSHLLCFDYFHLLFSFMFTLFIFCVFLENLEYILIGHVLSSTKAHFQTNINICFWNILNKKHTFHK